jgi:hypothetical protein
LNSIKLPAALRTKTITAAIRTDSSPDIESPPLAFQAGRQPRMQLLMDEV